MIDELDFTMLRTTCRRSRLIALSASTCLPALADVCTIGGGQTSTGSSPKARQEALPDDEYNMILDYMTTAGRRVRHHRTRLTTSRGPRILDRYGTSKAHYDCKDRTFSKRAAGVTSSYVYVQTEGGRRLGSIRAIWQLGDGDAAQRPHYFIIDVFPGLEPEHRLLNPFERLQGFLSTVSYNTFDIAQAVAVEPSAIICHAVCRIRPEGAFGIDAPLIVSIPADRGREVPMTEWLAAVQ